ncbi:outer membrane beta-barrel protein [Spirosoma flavus]
MNTFKSILTSALLAASTVTFAQTTVTITTTNDSTNNTSTHVIKHERNYHRVTSDFGIYLGFNNFGGALPTGYEFSPLGSRFFALAWQQRIPLLVNGSTKLRLITGPEVAWNNFMFENNNTLRKQNEQLIVEAAPVNLSRSKLVTAQLNLPVMVNITFRSRFSISAGAYYGMRLDSYTKVKPDGGSASRTHDRYNLNSTRWGYLAEVGFRGHTKLFFRYEPDSPFRSGMGPDASVWAVGIKL